MGPSMVQPVRAAKPQLEVTLKFGNGDTGCNFFVPVPNLCLLEKPTDAINADQYVREWKALSKKAFVMTRRSHGTLDQVRTAISNVIMPRFQLVQGLVATSFMASIMNAGHLLFEIRISNNTSTEFHLEFRFADFAARPIMQAVVRDLDSQCPWRA